MTPSLPSAHRRLRTRILSWYEVCSRQLPWRGCQDPYPVLVSEIMLQQTQVSRVETAFPAFLATFGDVAALAAATPAEVLTAWRGLGYNRRALNLHRAAQAIMAEHGGVVPSDVAALRRLPGVGEYTARAVAAFAHGVDVAPVDTNVARVLARAFQGAPLTAAAAQRLADELVPAGRAADWSQALMDLGAGWCAARSPRCEQCPIRSGCAWRSSGRPDDPVPRPRGSTQAFVDSDRYHRGRIVEALRHGPLGRAELPAAADLADAARLEQITTGLERDGLVEWRGGALVLPQAAKR